jgi:hypothetical protein
MAKNDYEENRRKTTRKAAKRELVTRGSDKRLATWLFGRINGVRYGQRHTGAGVE